MSTVETRLSPLPILRDSCTDLRVLVLQPLQESPPITVDVRPPLPPKTSKLPTQTRSETQPLIAADSTLTFISQVTPVSEENDMADQRV